MKSQQYSVIAYAEHDHHLPKAHELEERVKAALAIPNVSLRVNNVPKHSGVDAVRVLTEIRAAAAFPETFDPVWVKHVIDQVLGPVL